MTDLIQKIEHDKQHEAQLQILNERELSAALGLSSWTVRRMRIEENCPYFKIGSRIFYRLETVLAWISQKEQSGQQLEKIETGRIRRIY